MDLPTIKKLSDSKPSDITNNNKAREKLGEKKGLDQCQVCPKPVWISCFFDGTGNNYEKDGNGSIISAKTNYSNIAKLSHFAHPKNGDAPRIYNFYAEGVGTPFTDPIHNKTDTGDGIDHATGMAFAANGQMRLDWMLTSVEQSIAKNMPKVSQINVAVFGFSRGAAEARAFVHQLADLCKRSGNSLFWTKGNPEKPPELKFYYLGILDTVSSVGLGGSRIEKKIHKILPYTGASGTIISIAYGMTAKNGHASWAEDISIPEYIVKCDHFIATHEVREKFPSDSTRIGKSVPSNVYEILYPGMHSDVGGGYMDDIQEHRSHCLANIPLCNLYFSAYAAGVPFKSPGEIFKATPQLFDISADLEKCFNNYMSFFRGGPDGNLMGNAATSYTNLEDGVIQHMRLYYIWRWGRTARQKAGTLPHISPDKWMQITDREWSDDVNELLHRKRALYMGSEQDVIDAHSEEWRKQVYDERATLIDKFFDLYVHDSIAGFKDLMDQGDALAAEQSRWTYNRVYFMGRNTKKNYLYWQYSKEMDASNAPIEFNGAGFE